MIKWNPGDCVCCEVEMQRELEENGEKGVAISTQIGL